VGHDTSSILALMLVILVFLWLLGATTRRVKDIVKTNTVMDSNAASVDRKDNPIWYWYTLKGLVVVVFVLVCAVIGVVIAFFI
jgi:hypothetical protein